MATATPALWAETVSHWQMAEHLRVVDRALMRLVNPSDPLCRLAVFMPPRHGKSELISKHLPAWYLGTHPNKHVILVSHTQRLASDFGGRARNLLVEHGRKHYGVEVSSSTSARDNWQIEGHGGGLVAAGIGGPITGKGADLFIVDDPVKNAQEASSPITQDAHWQWWQSTASTRMEPGCGVVLMQTRWHRNELVGRILAESGDEWEIISLPAIAGEDDPWRQPGEALWPERWPIEKLEAIKATKTPYWWQAMYQQAPPQYGESSWPTEWFQDIIATEWPEKFESSAIAIDPALGGGKKRGDYSCIAFVGKYGGKLWVDCHLGRPDPIRLLQIALGWYAKYRPDVFVCESNGFQQLLGPMFHGEAEAAGLPGIECGMVTNTGDKISRIETTLTPYLSRGLLKIGADTLYNKMLIEQLRSIPNGDHDDGPDALEMAARALRDYECGSFRFNRLAGSVAMGM